MDKIVIYHNVGTTKYHINDTIELAEVQFCVQQRKNLIIKKSIKYPAAQ